MGFSPSTANLDGLKPILQQNCKRDFFALPQRDMAKKYERRRALKESQAPGADPDSAPRSQPDAGWKVRPQPVQSGGHRAGRGVVVAICGLLVLGTLAVFGQTVRHGFVSCDDNLYVYENRHIQRGLTPARTGWAITQAHSANWHPLTWMSHMLDWQVFGTWDAELGRLRLQLAGRASPR